MNHDKLKVPPPTLATPLVVVGEVLIFLTRELSIILGREILMVFDSEILIVLAQEYIDSFGSGILIILAIFLRNIGSSGLGNIDSLRLGKY